MKMKKIFILGGLLLSGALVSGCSDFLEVKKYGASTAWETQGDIDKAIAALYSFTTNDSEGVTGRGIMWFECCSDRPSAERGRRDPQLPHVAQQRPRREEQLEDHV